MKICRQCRRQIADNAVKCPYCGAMVNNASSPYAQQATYQNNNRGAQQPYYRQGQQMPGRPAQPYGQYQNAYETQFAAVHPATRLAAYRKLANYEKVSGIIWLIIGIIQCVTFVCIPIGIWNIVMSTRDIKFSKSIETGQATNLYRIYENSLSSIIIAIVLNLFFGAFIGVFGAITDLIARNYVMSNRVIFDYHQPLSMPYYALAQNASVQYGAAPQLPAHNSYH